MVTARKRLRDHYRDKGFWDADISITQTADSSFENGAKLNIAIDKGEKIKVGEIVVEGVANLESKQVMRAMKDLKEKKWYRIFKSSKFVEANLDQTAKSSVSTTKRGTGTRVFWAIPFTGCPRLGGD